MKQDSVCVMIVVGALKKPRGLHHPLSLSGKRRIVAKHLCSHTSSLQGLLYDTAKFIGCML